MKKFLLCLLSVLFLAGCVTTSYSNSNCEIHNESGVPMEKDKVIGIAVCNNAAGQTLSNIIMQEAESYCSKVVIFGKNSVIGDFSDKELASCDYVIIPKILVWEDKNAAFNNNDYAEVTVEIYNSNKELIRTGSVSGKSSTTNGPAEIMAGQFNTFFDCLFN